MKIFVLILMMIAAPAQADDMAALEKICADDLGKGECPRGQGVLTIRCLAVQKGLQSKCHEAVTHIVNTGALPKAAAEEAPKTPSAPEQKVPSGSK